MIIGSAAFAQSEMPPKERRCHECNTLNRLDAKFCKQCGAELPSLAPGKSIPAVEPTRFPEGSQQLDSLTHDELLQVLYHFKAEKGDSLGLPDESIAYMTEPELRSMITGIVRRELAQQKVVVKSDPIGTLLKVIGGMTLFLGLILVLAA